MAYLFMTESELDNINIFFFKSCGTVEKIKIPQTDKSIIKA
jgi:hypothetical protein